MSGNNVLIPIRECFNNNVINDEVLKTINKFIEYSLRNGPEFEENVKAHEADNSKFEFLRSGISNIFYRWKLYTKQQQLTQEQIDNCIFNYGKYIALCPPGCLDLLEIDRFELKNLLQDNTGSRNDISKICEFCTERAHSSVAIGQEFAKYTNSIVGHLSHSSNIPIGHLMKVVDVLNDIIFRCGDCSMEGVYTNTIEIGSTIDRELSHSSTSNNSDSDRLPLDGLKIRKVNVIECIWENLCYILSGVFYASQLMNVSENPDEYTPNSNKLIQMVEKWEKKQKITSTQMKFLIHSMKTLSKPEWSVSSVDLVSPMCPENILPVAAVGVEVLQIPTLGVKPRMELQPPVELFSPYGPAPPGYSPRPPPMAPPVPVAVPVAPPQYIPVGSAPPQHQVPPHMPPIPIAPPMAVATPVWGTPVNQYHTHTEHWAAPPTPDPGIGIMTGNINTEMDFQGISVGRMADMMKSAGNGYILNTPLDLTRWRHAPPPRVEPARLEARVHDFYKKLSDIQKSSAIANRDLNPNPYESSILGINEYEPTNKRPRSNSYSNEFNSNSIYSDRKLPSTARKERYQMLLQESQIQDSKSANAGGSGSLAADNIGHTLLKGMGWDEGKGLGSTGSGIQAPVSVTSNRNRSGIGSNTSNR